MPRPPQRAALSPFWRLLIVTGFLGGLTTFSTFSAEVVTALLEGRSLLALSTVVTQFVGDVVMTLLGVGTVRLLRSTDGMAHAFVELADQPVEIMMAVSPTQAASLFGKINATETRLLYIKTPIKYGELGAQSAASPGD